MSGSSGTVNCPTPKRQRWRRAGSFMKWPSTPRTATSRRSWLSAPTETTANGSAILRHTPTSGTCFYRNPPQRGRDNQSEGIRPCFIDDYLDRHGASGEVRARPGAWNTGWHDGSGFTQWISSSAQQRSPDSTGRDQPGHLRCPPQCGRHLSPRPGCAPPAQASHWRVLRAETSCNFFWGDAWLQRCHDDLDQATDFLDQAVARIT